MKGLALRFDDTLETVLAGDLGTPFGMQSAWRQLVDLIGRRRVPPDTRALAVLRRIRAQVPPPVRQASARGLEHANPPAPLVRLFAMDDLPVALPVLRSARMTSADWIQLLPDLSPAGRAVLRNRRDLSPIVRRALETYGPIDFVLPDESRRHEVVAEPEPMIEPEPVEPEPEPIVASEPEPVVVEPEPEPVVVAEPEPEPVVAIAPPVAPAPAVRPQPVEQLVDWTDVLAIPVPEPTPLVLAAQPAKPTLVGIDPAALVVAAAAATGVSLPIGEAIAPAVPSIQVGEAPAPAVAPPESEPIEDLSFVALAGVAAALPNATILGPAAAPPVQSGTAGAAAAEQPIAPAPEPAQQPPMAPLETVLDSPAAASFAAEEAPEGPFEIAEVVARIDAFWRNREEHADAPPRPATPAEHFRFETDAKGVIRWVDGVSRAPIVGLSLDHQAGAAIGPRVDGVAAGAFRRRAGFSNARLEVDGDSDAAGGWLISAIPVFDPANGRFTGYRGTARRPRADERAEPTRAAAASADSLRQLVHELRTPTNAIAGFAEMIEAQMLGPVADPYRERASVIRGQARDLLGAIDDLDLAARIDSDALSLAAGRVPLRPLFAGIAEDLAQLSALRGSWIALPIEDLAVHGDRRAVERLLARLMATFVSASGPGERIGVRTSREADGVVAISLDRPQALSEYPGDSLLAIDDEGGDATLLGTGFALRLARNLARELGGSLAIGAESLTLRLPASDNAAMGQAHQS